MDCSQQKTPNESQAVGLIRVAHPQHRLRGKLVKVLGRDSGHWLIAGREGQAEKLPVAWGEEVPAIIVQAEEEEAWVGVTELLNLVTMIARLRVQPPEEVEDEDQHRCDGCDQRPAEEPSPGRAACAVLGANSAGEAAGTVVCQEVCKI